MRAQDKWNDKNGYKSKSYKVYEQLSKDFLNSCNIANVSQSKQLSHMMNNYVIKTLRSEKTMLIRQHYSEPYDYESVIQKTLEKYVFEFYDNDVENKKQELLSNRGFGSIIFNTFPYSEHYTCKNDLIEYLSDSNSGIVLFVRDATIKQIALMKLMNENKIMPTGFRTDEKIEIVVDHSRGNIIFDLYLDSLPFSKFMVIKTGENSSTAN